MFVGLLVALATIAGCAQTPRATTPAACGAGWASVAAPAAPDVDTERISDRLAARAAFLEQRIADVHVTGVAAPLARTLEATLATRAGNTFATAPIADDLRRLWALGVVDDASVEITGDRVAFVVTPRSRVGRVVVAPETERALLQRFQLLEGALYEPLRIERITAAVTQAYVRSGHTDARVDVSRMRRGGRFDVCVAAVPGPRVTIRSVTFPGRRRMPEATLLARLHGADANINRVGGTFDAGALDNDQAYLLDAYYERGMISASIGAVRTRRVGAQLELAIPIDEGPEYTVGTLALRAGPFGAPRVAIPLHDGELFQRSRVQAAIAALSSALGADVEPVTHIDQAHQRVDITFEISERVPWDALRLWLSR